MPLSQIVSASIEDGAVAPVDLSSVAQYTGFKNRLINGAFGIWQRGTSGFTTLSAYAADRWYVFSNTSLSTGARSTDVPTGFQYSFSIAGTNFPQLAQRIESVNCTDLVGQNVTISFWAKQTSGAGAGSIGVQLIYPNSADAWSGATTQIGTNQTFTGTTGWVQYSTTFTSLPAGAANGLLVNLFANTAGTAALLFTGVQLEKGVTATSFDYRPYGTEFLLCQRYYQYIANGDALIAYTYSAYYSSNRYRYEQFIVPMRTTPTMTGTPGSDAGYTATALAANSLGSFAIQMTMNATNSYGFYSNIRASAEL
jgi:hypothetical protein